MVRYGRWAALTLCLLGVACDDTDHEDGDSGQVAADGGKPSALDGSAADASVMDARIGDGAIGDGSLGDGGRGVGCLRPSEDCPF